MKRIYHRVCGMDVHRDTVNVCVRLPEHGEEDDGLVAQFGTTTEDLLALRDWPFSRQPDLAHFRISGEKMCQIRATPF